MPKGGWLSVASRAEDGQVIVEVADTGSGIPSEYLARIYDPFFTTKAIGQGTGLGLSITYGIVREHDGTIDCESIVGHGTRFILRFPPAPAERAGARGCNNPRRSRACGATVPFSSSTTKRSCGRSSRRCCRARGTHVRLAASGCRRPRAREVVPVRRRDRRRDDAGHGRHADARGAEEARRRPAGADDHGVRVGRDRDRGDEARRVRLHHQAVQERRSARRRAQRRRATAADRREHRAQAATCRRRRRTSPASSAAVRR